MKDKVIITGITGFVGQNLEKHLQTDFLISGVSRKSNKINFKNLNESHYNKSKAFIHLAGKAHDLKNTSDDKEYFEVNFELTKKLFDQFLESDCEVFIFMSSVKAVADKVLTVLKEEELPNPITAYGKSKLAAEEYILSKELPLDKRVYILRPCMIHGPNNKGNLNLLYSIIKKGIPYPLGAYKNKRSFVSIKNLCFIINELIYNNNVSSGIYNIADDESISTNDLVSLIGNVTGKSTKILNVNKSIIKLIALLGNFLPLPINTERLKKLTENYEVSNLKIKKAILKELPLDTIAGLKKTIKSFV